MTLKKRIKNKKRIFFSWSSHHKSIKLYCIMQYYLCYIVGYLTIMKSKFLVVLCCFFFLKIIVAQIPSYYQNIDLSTSADALKVQLSNLITGTHQNQIPYTSTVSIDTWDVLKNSDSYLLDTSKVYLVYGWNDNDSQFENDITRDKALSCHGSPCDGLWNREHVYPKSLAFPNLTTNIPGPGTDAHNLRACDYNTNSWRGNLEYDNGIGNAAPSNSGWYPGDDWRGDVARIIMYMYTRYPTQCPALNVGNGSAIYSNNADIPDIFLEWNQIDSVSQFEISRNEAIYLAQGNRNPFIDNPYLATLIWNGPSAENRWIVNSINFYPNQNCLIYPNPVKDIIEVKTNKKIEKIILRNGYGQQIKVTNSKRLKVEEVPSGIYFLEVFTQEGRSFSKVVKK